MLKIVGTSTLPAVEADGASDEYCLELSDVADNPYTIVVGKEVYDTVNNLQETLKDTAKFAG